MAEEGDNSVVERISKDVLRMNFMKRTTFRMEKQEKMQQQQKANEMITAGKVVIEAPRYYPTVEHIDDDPNWTLGGIMSEWRYTVLENFKFGRFSFNGQNPEIEKWMKFHECRRLGLADPEETSDDFDEERDNSEGNDEREEGELTNSEEEAQQSDDNGPPPEKKFCAGNVHFRSEIIETNSWYERKNGQKRQQKGGNPIGNDMRTAGKNKEGNSRQHKRQGGKPWKRRANNRQNGVQQDKTFKHSGAKNNGTANGTGKNNNKRKRGNNRQKNGGI